MKHTRALIGHLQSLEIPVEKRNEYLCSAIAVGLATQFPMPTGKVKNIMGHYNDNHRSQAVKFINTINEEIVFDAAEAIALTGKTYALRYAFAFEAQEFNVAAHLMTLMGVDRLATPVKYNALLSDRKAASVATDVQRTVMQVFGNYLEERAHDPKVSEVS